MIKTKLRSKRGFSLMEQLVTLVIFGLVTMLVASGITMASNVHKQSLFESESQVLISTLNTALADVLRYGNNIETEAGGTVTKLDSLEIYTIGSSNYFKYGINDGMLLVDGDGHIAYRRGSGDEAAVELINAGTYNDMKVRADDFSLTYDPGTFVFTVSYSVEDEAGATVKGSGEMKVQSLKAKYSATP